ncbi:protein kinase family protein [Aquibacillus sp. 3ASR75-11]|uniref:Protein kinase family protein n=1 Tax=Terrihalobacillus insolitus TaxID=2950438 RepID=A0A9X3WUP6_9BACI|nr:protein kinase family protein [Terrihalobacillus insolitus]MDC3414853.1 protein kinase family protein [Terrihalobacillus insolitus]MDC3426252.1 protein kinase family protein [Terrihalobacillus insolitus]
MKMNQASRKPELTLSQGGVIKGKWHKNRYTIKGELGHGAIGKVYLCESNGKQAALKISEKSSSITTEVNVLKTFQKVQGHRLGPSLLDVDDWVHPKNGHSYSFYVMEYLKGKPLSFFIKSHGEEWLGIFMLQLLDDLAKLHESGWVFGDLKPDNLIVTYAPPRLRWIDVGGTTQIGRSIKEYTEFYDRGYWGMGSRKAEPSYDLFALVMVMFHLYYPNRFEKGRSPEKTLMNKLHMTPQLKKFEPCLIKALQGKYSSSKQMKRDISAVLMNQQKTDTIKKKQQTPPVKRATHQGKSTVRKPKKEHPFMEGVGIFAVVLLFYTFYLIFS